MEPTTAKVILLVLILAAYFIGGIPFGLIVGRARGIDVRTAGSGNIGATNVGRLLGKKFFYFVLFLDALKALVPTAIASAIVYGSVARDERTSLLYLLWLAVGAAALLGHVFSPFLKFKGGKGVATGLGLVLGTFPYLTLPGLIALGVFVGVYKATRYISAGSITAAVTLPIAYLLLHWLLDWQTLAVQWPILVVSLGMATLIIIRHRANIRRLIAGTEPKSA